MGFFENFREKICDLNQSSLKIFPKNCVLKSCVQNWYPFFTKTSQNFEFLRNCIILSLIQVRLVTFSKLGDHPS